MLSKKKALPLLFLEVFLFFWALPLWVWPLAHGSFTLDLHYTAYDLVALVALSAYLFGRLAQRLKS